MGILLLLLITEILSLITLYQHFYGVSKIKYYVSILIHTLLSIWIWILFFAVANYKSYFDAPQHVWLMLNFNATIIAVIIPRTILAICHFSGSLIKLRSGGHIRWLTNTGLAIMTLVLIIVVTGTLHGRFNFKTEPIIIKIKGLKKELEGLKIAQISDLHLAGFYHHPKVLQKVMEEVNALKPDLIINTGDFVTYGWREFDGNDTILLKAKSKYGNFAILGNHDFGTYDPDFTQADRDTNVLMLNNLISASGYKVLNDEYTKVSIGDARIGLIGVITMGRYPNIIHGDLVKATSGLDSVDIKILLSHDPKSLGTGSNR